jgi:5-methylcytosine-specific restriction endonuclease McrA
MISRTAYSKRSSLSRVSAKAKREAQVGTAIRITRDGKDICLRSAEGRTEYKRRTLEMAQRQGLRCAICGSRFDGWLGDPTFDHEAGRSAGKRDDSIEVNGEWHNAALHRVCNQLKGSRAYTWALGLYLPVVKEEANGTF